MKMQTVLTIATMTLGVLSLGAMLFAHLALTDIYHGETDVSLEWNIVRGAALVILMFTAATLWTLGRALAAREL
jgi:hypothetical protein